MGYLLLAPTPSLSIPSATAAPIPDWERLQSNIRTRHCPGSIPAPGPRISFSRTHRFLSPARSLTSGSVSIGRIFLEFLINGATSASAAPQRPSGQAAVAAGQGICRATVDQPEPSRLERNECDYSGRTDVERGAGRNRRRSRDQSAWRSANVYRRHRLSGTW